MKEFFKVTDLEQVLAYASDFPRVGTEEILLEKAAGRVLAENIVSNVDLPDFVRATMDGYAVKASSTFGSTEGNPGYLSIKGAVEMGESPLFSIASGEAAKISTGGMLPHGADSVVMIEHAEAIDDATIEVYKSVAPGQNVLEKGEDVRQGETILACGRKLRSQETGLLAALGKEAISVYRRPVIAVISTGDEIVPVNEIPGPGQIRDINTYTLANLVRAAGGVPLQLGIVRDNFNDLLETCTKALAQSDMMLISGGSSVGTRDFTIEVLAALPDAGILVHGISISPGKPTILARSRNQALWGLPGHVASAMVVFEIVVRPFIEHIAGLSAQHKKVVKPSAMLSRNLSSAQGRIDYVRVRLVEKEGVLWAEPLLGKSGLIRTMVQADGLIEININSEGLDKGTKVEVLLL
ncbi:MAG: molybdopterin molybdotransferase MoeA [Desulfobacterales bacterium]|uniref:Molybdopterin molybdenumtransferase n=1 Tax=Candidatus Desulfatibia vada TaxID=2841696 RepID=A0A8J6TN84_9BACT|nr:molybdopterin molybdotransferase MoeA [Candidatus Desulfatibia vada]